MVASLLHYNMFIITLKTVFCNAVSSYKICITQVKAALQWRIRLRAAGEEGEVCFAHIAARRSMTTPLSV